MSAWVGPIIQAIAIVIGAGVVAWQVGKQFEHGRALQQLNAREKLWLEIYREIIALDQVMSSNAIEASNFVLMLNSGFRLELGGTKSGLTDRRAIDFHGLHYKLINSVADVIIILERYEIIKPELELFRIAFLVAIEEIKDAQYDLFPLYTIYLPQDIPKHLQEKTGIELIPAAEMDQEKFENLEKRGEEYIRSVHNITSFAYDLRVETQNLLLGNLFEHRVPTREPIDPSETVVTTEPPKKAAELKEFFEKNTKWGERKREVDASVQSDLKANKRSWI